MSNSLNIREHYPLRDLTTFRIGGPARYFVEAAYDEDVVHALSFARESRLPILVIGGGSNILVGDSGFSGLVILNRIKGMRSQVEQDRAFVTAGGGEDWDGFVRHCVENNRQGVECMSGIPGTVGASPVQNIGAYGQSVDSVIHEVRAVDVISGQFAVFSKDDCGFGYRESIFNTAAAGGYIITSVTFSLALNSRPELSYRELRNYFSGWKDVTLRDIRKAVLETRDKKGLLLMEGYEGLKSAGSFFKNPVVSPALFGLIKNEVESSGCCENWAWPQPSGEVKVSAACLMQCAGFMRGYRVGNVGISPKHSLCIVNHADATASEVLAFSELIREKVLDKFGVKLTPEVKFYC